MRNAFEFVVAAISQMPISMLNFVIGCFKEHEFIENYAPGKGETFIFHNDV